MQPDLISTETLDTLPPLLRDYVADCHDSMRGDPQGWFDADTAPPEHVCLFVALCDALERGYEHLPGGYPFGHTASQWKTLYRQAEQRAAQMQATFADLPRVDSRWRIVDEEANTCQNS